MKTVNLNEKFDLFEDHWHPRLVGVVNDCHVKIAKLQGEFVWHTHEQEDEMFFVVRGELLIKTRAEDFTVRAGEFLIVPRGVEHQPVADQEVWLVLVEPGTTLNTGNVENEKTVHVIPTV